MIDWSRVASHQENNPSKNIMMLKFFKIYVKLFNSSNFLSIPKSWVKLSQSKLKTFKITLNTFAITKLSLSKSHYLILTFKLKFVKIDNNLECIKDKNIYWYKDFILGLAQYLNSKLA